MDVEASSETPKNEDVGVDAISSLHAELEKINQRAINVVAQCAGRMKAVHDVAIDQLQDVFKQLHNDNKQFLEQVAVAIMEGSSKSAGTGEMAMDREKVNMPSSRKMLLPGTPEDSDGSSRSWLDARLKERGIDIATASNDVAVRIFEPNCHSRRMASAERLNHARSCAIEDALPAKEESGNVHRITSGGFGFKRSLERPPYASSPRVSPIPSPRQLRHSTMTWTQQDTQDDAHQRHHSQLPAIRRQGHFKGSRNTSQAVLTKTKTFERKKTLEDIPEISYLKGDMLKEEVRTALLKHRYDVKEQYSKSGIAQQIARSNIFELFTISVVMLNAAWIAIALDLNDKEVLAESDAVFQIGEHAFCAYFTVELLIRFLAFRTTRLALKDHWFMFDTILVSLMIFETWVFEILIALGHSGNGSVGVSPDMLKLLRLLRLTRMARMARLLRWVPELMILLKGLWLASKSVFFTLVLLVLTVYLFALVFRQITDSTPIGDQYFPSVWTAFLSLLLKGTLPDLADWVNEVGRENLFLAALLMVFILFATLTVMNMLVGVLVEVVANVSTMENETMMVNMVRAKMLLMIEKLELDKDGNGTLSKAEFEQLLVLPEAAQFMQSVGVDVVGLVEFSDFIFKEKELTFPDFVELVLQLRGSNQATVKDIVDMRKQMTAEFEAMSFEFSNHSNALGRIIESERREESELGALVKSVDALQQALRSSSLGTPNAPKLIEERSSAEPEPQPPTINPPALYDDSAWSRLRDGKLVSEQTNLESEVPVTRGPAYLGNDNLNSDQEALYPRVPVQNTVNVLRDSAEMLPLLSADHETTSSKRPFSAKRTQLTSDQRAQWNQMMEKFATDVRATNDANQPGEAEDLVPFPGDLRGALGGFHRFDPSFDHEEEV